MNWLQQNFQLVTAFSAVFISLVSLMVAVLTLRAQKKHNKLSVKPVAHISKGDYEDKIFVRLKNYGNGPMFIDSFIVQNERGEFKKLIESFGDVATEIMWDTFSDTLDGRVLAPDKEFTLIECSFDDEATDDVKAEIRSYLASTTLVLDYKCTYGVKQAKLLEKLDWFSRH